MKHHEEDLLSPTMKRTPLLAMKGLLPETKTIRMKTSVFLLAFLLVCIGFLGFRYWTVYQLNDRSQRRIAFLERSIYRSSKDGDDAATREHDFQRELKRQKERLLQMNVMMNAEVAKLKTKCQLQTDELIRTVDSKEEIIKQNEALLSSLKKDYEQLQQHMATFQANQSQLLEKFTTQSVRAEMLLKLKDRCYAQMKSLGKQVLIPTNLGQEVPVQEGTGVVVPSRGSSVAGTPARESPGKGLPAQESPGKGLPAEESPRKGVPARESPIKVGPAEAAPARPSAVLETPARESPGKGLPARDGPLSKAGQSSKIQEASEKEAEATPTTTLKTTGSRGPAQPPQLGKEPDDIPPHPDEPEAKEAKNEKKAMAAPTPALKPSDLRTQDQPLSTERKDKNLGQSSVNEKANEKEAEAAPTPALLPLNLRVPVKPPPMDKERNSIPSGPEKSDTEVQKQKKVASGASVVKEDKDVLPPVEEKDKAPAGKAGEGPANKIQPDSQPKKQQNNEGKEEEEEYVI